MLISTTMMILLWVIGIASIPLLIFSIINKTSTGAKTLFILGLYFPACCFMMMLVSDWLSVHYPLSIVFYYMAVIPFAVIDLASLIVNIVKMIRHSGRKGSGGIVIAAVVLALIPVVIFGGVCLRQFILLRTSELVVGMDSSGNGGIGDSSSFVYTYDGNDIHLIDIGSTYGLEKLAPADMYRSKDNTSAGKYRVEIEGEYFFIYEDNSVVEKHRFESGYSNVSINEMYYYE